MAFIALCLYVLFTLTVMKWIDATFSLAAIAGFISRGYGGRRQHPRL